MTKSTTYKALNACLFEKLEGQFPVAEGEIRDLLDQGADPNAMKGNLTAFEIAVGSGYRGVVRMMLDHSKNKIDLNRKSDVFNNTVLIVAIMSNWEDIFHLMIEAGADINAPSKDDKRTPLMWCMDHKRQSMLQALIDRGADFYLRDEDGNNAFDYARGNPIEGMDLVETFKRRVEKKVTEATVLSRSIPVGSRIHLKRGGAP